MQSWWTEERVSELRMRWANNESGSMIAIAMHAMSRNAVVGKLYRLGLHRQPIVRSNNGHKRVRRPTVHYADGRVFIKGDTVLEEDAPPIFNNPKLLMALNPCDCRWPGFGRGAQMLYCGAPAVDGKAYCLTHCRIAYVRPGATPRPLR
jgi:GcrA cell cycle regulator